MLKNVEKVSTKVYKNSYIDNLFRKEKKITADDVLKRYSEAMANKKLIEITFSKNTPAEDLVKEEAGVTVIMQKRDTDPRINRLYGSAMRLSVLYQVEVKKIDYDTNTVYVSSLQTGDEVRNEVIKEIDNGIKNEEYLVLPAIVTKVVPKSINGESMVYVDIAKMHIFGVIRLSEWSTAFTDSFDYCVKAGNVLNVVVLGKAEWKSGTVYDCSRRLTLNEADIWKDIEKKYPRNTKLRITCTSKRDKHFFGIIDGVQDLKILCEYPRDKNIQINVGGEYVGFVYVSSEKNRKLSMRILEEIVNDDDLEVKDDGNEKE